MVKSFPCVSAKDYKKIGNGDTGLNTGGMGTVALVQNLPQNI
jgi:phosphoribosylamine--glycine ligase